MIVIGMAVSAWYPEIGALMGVVAVVFAPVAVSKNRKANQAREAEEADVKRRLSGADQTTSEQSLKALSSILLDLERAKEQLDAADNTAAMAFILKKKTNRTIDNIQRHRIPPPLADS